MSRQMGMLVDLRKCYGCNSCTVACKQEHALPAGTTRLRIETVGPTGTFPELKMHFEPRRCVQCANPPCVDACTRQAIRRRPDGIVVIDREKCIGDALCVPACPYGAIEFDGRAEAPEKCDLCAERLEQGVHPSCVVACPGRALLVGDFADPQSRVSRAVAMAGEENVLVPNSELGTGPALRCIKPDAQSPPLAFTTLFDPDRDISGILPSLVTPVDESAGERVVKSVCRACHGVCGVRIIVKDGRVIKVEGDPECITNFGTLCPKGLASIQHLYNPDRLLYPLKRSGERGEGKWERVTWEEAMDTLVAKLTEVRDRYGPEHVALARGTGRVWNDFGRRFTNVYGTATGMTKSPNCYFPRIEVSKAHAGHRIPVCDYYGFGGEYPKCVLVWGNNIVGSNADGMAGARFIDSINRGARLIVIDPAFTNLAAKADLWLPVRPVTDAALAMSLLNVVVSEGLFDSEFVTRWSNAPFLVRRDTGALLTERDLRAEGSEKSWFALDRSGREVVPTDTAGLVPALDGGVTVSLADGRKVECSTVWTVLKERLEGYTPEAVEEITWVPAQRIREAARLFATTKPAVVQWGVSFDHQGINSTRTGHAALILMAITGNIDVPGGMALWVNGGWIDGPSPEHVLLDLVPQRALDFVADYGRREFPLFCRGTSYMSHGSLVEAGVLEGKLQLQAAIIVGNNPAVESENARQAIAAFKKIPFLVCFDLYMTPTAEICDLVLPVSTWMERDQVGDEHFGWGILCRQKAVESQGESRSDEEIFLELGKRMGLGKYFTWKNIPEYLNWRLHRTGITWEELKKTGCFRGPVMYRKYETDFYRPGGGFPTPTGRMEVYSSTYQSMGADPLPYFQEPGEETPCNAELAREYPLIVTTRRVPYYFLGEHRMIPWLRELEPDPILEMHPDAARARDLRDGDWGTIETMRGKIRMKVRVTSGIHPRVVRCPHGWWFPEKSAAEGLHGAWESNFNVITRNDRGQGFDPMWGCPQLRGLMCQVSKAGKDSLRVGPQ